MTQELLPYIAGALQWARARKRFSEIYFILIVAGASFLFYAMANPSSFLSAPWNEILSAWWEQAKTILATVQLVSSGSNVIASTMKPGAAIPASLPVTNSQA